MAKSALVSSLRLAIFAPACAFLATACGSAATPGSAPDMSVSEDAGGSFAPPAPDAAGGDAPAPLPVDAGMPQPAPVDSGPANTCPALRYPSGVKIQTFTNAAMTATYADHLGSGESAPVCFLDVDNLVNPDTQEVYPITVNVAAHFMLQELVGTEVDEGYGHIVLMVPAAVASLEDFRESLNTPVSVNSGFRGPKHQEATCDALCGNPLGCPGTCANNSRHMFGDAFDLPLEFYTTPDEHLACSVGFKFAYLESGTHLHIDQNPAYATCVIE